jgi:hypothetical protein
MFFNKKRRLLSLFVGLATFSMVALGFVALRPATAHASTLMYQLDPGDQLGIDNYIGSPDHQYWLTIEPDGNVRESQLGSDLTVASTATHGHPGSILKMQTDGNLVIIAPGNVPVWASGTAGNPGTVLQIQDDGALVLYAPGHQALKVLVPQLFDPNNSVATPQPLPTTEAPDVEPSEVTQAVYDGTSVVGCATAGKVAEELPDGGTVAGIAEEQLCGMATDTSGAELDGYGVMRLGSSIALSLISAPAAAAWDILSEPEDAY